MAKYTNPIVYERIVSLVKSHGMVMYDLSKKLSISTGNMSDWKTGKSIPGAEKLIKIADYFNVSVDYLLGRDNFVANINADADCIELTNIYKDLDREGKVTVMSSAYKEKRRLSDERTKEA